MCLQEKSFENTVFPTRLENLLPFACNLKLSSANSLSLEESKICRLGRVNAWYQASLCMIVAS